MRESTPGMTVAAGAEGASAGEDGWSSPTLPLNERKQALYTTYS